MIFIRFIVFIIIGIGLGIVFNKFIIKHFFENKRKLFYILTMIIFILSSISLAVTFSIKSGIILSINIYSDRVEKYIFDNNQNNQFLINGINLNIISDNSSIINDSINQLRTLVPTHADLKINKGIYDMVIGTPMDELINQINNLTNFVTNKENNAMKSVSMIADNNNFITISSIFVYLKFLANKHINAIFLRIIILLFLPLIIYILSISIYIIISIRKR